VSTYRDHETLTVDAPFARVDAVFTEFWRKTIDVPLNRPFAGPRPQRLEPGLYRQIKGGRHDHVETTVLLRPAGPQTEITYERVWRTPLPIGPLGRPLVRRGWHSLFHMWHEALEDYVRQSGDGYVADRSGC
jgi:hypothetical protein